MFRHVISRLSSAQILLLFLAWTNPPAQAQWAQTNLAVPGAAAVNTLEVNGSTLFAGTNGQGVFVSSNNGTTWSTMSGGLTGSALSINTLVVSGQFLFSGTNRAGVYRAPVSGGNWAAVNSGLNIPNVANPVIWAFTTNLTSLLAGTQTGGVFRTDNGGTNWAAVNTGFTWGTATALATAGSYLFAGTDNLRIYRSNNNGGTWTQVGSGITASIGDAIMSFAVNGFLTLFVGTWEGGGGGTVYRSTDNGANWIRVNSGLPNDIVRSLAVDGPTSHLFAATAANGVFRSTNNGDTWTQFNTGLSNAALAAGVNALHILDRNLFLGTGAGQVWRRALGESVPAQPSLRSPANGAVGVAVNPTLQWRNSIGATLYQLQISTNAGFTVLLVDQRGLTDTSSAVNGLATGTTYFWRVNASNGVGTSSWSDAWTFTTVAATQGAPIITAAGSVTSVSSDGATLQASVNPNGASTTTWFEWGTSSALTTYTQTPSEFIGAGTNPVQVLSNLTGLSANTSYYFRVVGQSNAGTTRGSIAGFTTSTSSTGRYTPDANTVLLLHVDETSGSVVTDASNYGNHGIAAGTTVVDGRFGKARSFNGTSDNISIPDNASLNITTALTVEAWVKLTDPSKDQKVVEKGPLFQGYLLGVRNAQLYPEIFDVGGTRFTVEAGVIPSNTWTHLAMTWTTGGRFIGYVNGVAVFNSPASLLAISTSTSNVIVGAASWYQGWEVAGLIDEVRISNRARSPGDFNLQLPPTNLSATASGAAISLSWQNGGGAVPLMRYKIYRGTDSTTTLLIDSTASTAYSNTGLTAGMEYYYRVSSVDSTGFEGARSYAVSATAGAGSSLPFVQLDTDPSWYIYSGTDSLFGKGPVRNSFPNSVEISALVNPRGLSTEISVEYGTTSSYGSKATWGRDNSLATNTYVTEITGLTPNTSYHYRVVAANSAGTSVTSDASFSTPAAPHGWTRQVTGRSDVLFGVTFVDALVGTAVGSGPVVLRTTNGGATWTSQLANTSDWLNAVAFVDANTGTAVGGASIIRTTNGGATWTNQVSGTTNWLFGISLVEASVGTVVGMGGTILRTTNGGATWTPQNSDTGHWLLGVSFAGANIGTIVGTGGTILRTTDGGLTWKSQSSGTTSFLKGVAFTDANSGIVVGKGGIILRTTNGGSTWEMQSSGTNNFLHGVKFVDANNGIIVGENGTILRTTNGGALWTNQASGTHNSLLGVSSAGGATTLVGELCTILRGTPASNVARASANTPTTYSLRQNYPNPANPGTTICYDLPKEANVCLKVYDLLGRPIATLLDAPQEAGYYQLRWIANVPSGIYFYRLRAGEFMETKKMMVVK